MFIYAVAAGATVLEYTAKIENALDGSRWVVLENAFVLPLNTILLPDQVPLPVILFRNPDLSFHTVTADVEFIVELSAPSNQMLQRGMSEGINARLNEGIE
jgi:hypothetical protein